MSLLLDRLPSELWICGRAVRVNTDFRYSILFEKLCLDRTIPPDEKAKKLFRLMFPDLQELPLEDPQQIFDALIQFYKGGERELNQYQIREQKKAEEQEQPAEERVYDYEYDDELIFAAFLQQYGIDLVEERLHWWKFRALFSGLTEDTKFIKVLGYRSAKITSKMSGTEKEHLRKMKELYALPIPLDEVEKAEKITDALRSGDAAAIMRMLEEENGQGT